MFHNCNLKSSEKHKILKNSKFFFVISKLIFIKFMFTENLSKKMSFHLDPHLTYLLRNLYTGQEATVRTGRGTTDWFQVRKRVHQGCILSRHLFNLHAEYIMRNAGLNEVQAGIKIAVRNINNPR